MTIGVGSGMGSATTRLGRRKAIGVAMSVLATVPLFVLCGARAADAFPSPLLSGVPTGETWVVCQGYNNTSISHNGARQYSLDLTADLSGVGGTGCTGSATVTGGRSVVAAGTGRIAWNNGAGFCINLDAGDSIKMYHTTGPAPGSRVNAGEPVGTVYPAGQGENAGYAHLHIAAYVGAGCADAGRTPFAGSARLGCGAPDMPNSGAFNQWSGTRLSGCASSTSTSPPAYSFQYVGQGSYVDSSRSTAVNTSALREGQRVWLTLTVKNTGTATWSSGGANPVRLGTWSPQDRASRFKDPTWLGANRAAQLSEPSVAPGANGTFGFWITVPPGTGTWEEHFNLLVEGRTWLPDIGVYWTLAVPPPAYTFQYVAQGSHSDSSRSTAVNTSALREGQRAWLTLTVKNTGTATWSSGGANPVRLGTWSPQDRASRFKDPTWLGANRAAQLSEPSVAPGANGTFGFWITVPPGTGTWEEHFNLLVEGLTWLPDVGVYWTLAVPTRSSPTAAPSPTAQPTPSPSSGASPSAPPSPSPTSTSSPSGAPVSLSAPSVATAGVLITVSGTAAPGAAVELWGVTAPNGTITRVNTPTVTADASGNWSKTIRPLRNVNLQARVGSAMSATRFIAVKTDVSESVAALAGCVVQVSGRVFEPKPGRTVFVRAVDAAGRTVSLGTGTVQSDGRFLLRKPYSCGTTLRVYTVIEGDAVNRPGSTATKTVTTRR